MVNEHPLCVNITNVFFINSSYLSSSPNTSDPAFIRFILSIFFFALSLLHIALTVPAFFILHSNERIAWIKIRSGLPVIMATLALLFQAIITYFPGFTIPLPSWIAIPMSLLIVPLSVGAAPLRLFDFYGRYVFSRAITQINIYENSVSDVVSVSHVEESDNERAIKGISMIQRNDAESTPKSHHKSSPANIASMNSPVSKRASNLSIDISDSGSESKLSTIRMDEITPSSPLPPTAIIAEVVTSARQIQLEDRLRNKVISSKELLFLRFIASPRFQYLTVLIGLIPLIIVVIVNFISIPALRPAANCVGVNPLAIYAIIIVLYGIISLAAGIKAVYMVQDFVDPFDIVHESKVYIMYGGPFILIFYILSALVTKIPVSFTFNYLITLVFNVMLGAITDYPIYLAVAERFGKFSFSGFMIMIRESIKREKRSRTLSSSELTSSLKPRVISDDSLNGNNLSGGMKDLLQALDDPKLVDDFEKHLIGEFSAENLRMFIECRKWETSYFDVTDSQRRSRAKKIIETFVEVGSIFEVNLPDGVRVDIEKTFSEKKNRLPQTLFARSQNEVLGMMYDPFQRYLKKKQPKEL